MVAVVEIATTFLILKKGISAMFLFYNLLVKT